MADFMDNDVEAEVFNDEMDPNHVLMEKTRLYVDWLCSQIN